MDRNAFTLPPFTVETVFTTLSQSQDWGLRKLRIPEMWQRTKGEGITIAVIDTGFPGTRDFIHPDLKNNMLHNMSETCIQGESIYDLKSGHGTFCCGIIAAEDNNIGYVGYAPKAKVLTIKALANNGSGSLGSIEKALEYAIQVKPDIVSMSLGAPFGSKRLHDLVCKLDSMCIPVIVAAGNGGAETGVLYPAKYREAFAIAAYDANGEVADFSAVGPEVDFAFPGVDVTSTFLNGGYAKLSGTSFACPACAGVVALIMAERKKEVAEGKAQPFKTTNEIYQILKDSAIHPESDGGRDVYSGWGIVDVSRLYVKSLRASDHEEDVKRNVPFLKSFWWSVREFVKSIGNLFH